MGGVPPSLRGIPPYSSRGHSEKEGVGSVFEGIDQKKFSENFLSIGEKLEVTHTYSYDTSEQSLRPKSILCWTLV